MLDKANVKIYDLTGITSEGQPTYAQGVDVTNIFGNENVFKWANIDNDFNEDTVINRVSWALGLAYQEVNSLLRDGPYTVPFAVPYPAKVVDANARLAACYLYDGRGIPDTDNDGNPVNKLSAHRQMVLDFIADVMGGRVKLEVAATSPTTYPQIVPIRLDRRRLGFRPGNSLWPPFWP